MFINACCLDFDEREEVKENTNRNLLILSRRTNMHMAEEQEIQISIQITILKILMKYQAYFVISFLFQGKRRKIEAIR